MFVIRNVKCIWKKNVCYCYQSCLNFWVQNLNIRMKCYFEDIDEESGTIFFKILRVIVKIMKGDHQYNVYRKGSTRRHNLGGPCVMN